MLLSTLALLLLPASTLAFHDRNAHEASRSRARLHYAKKQAVSRNETSLEKRDSYSGRATFFDVGLGACGWWNVASDYIVAQNSAQFGSSYPSPNCGKSITISYNGITAVATIADECPTCGYGSLDMSRGLFDHFASEDLGQFQMTWWYNDGSNNQQPTTTSQTPTSTWVAPTSTYTPPPPSPTTTSTTPTSTWVAPTTTSTTPTTTDTPSTSSTTPSSTSTTSFTSTSPIVSSVNATSTMPFAYQTNVNASSIASATGSAAPSGVPVSDTPETLGNLVSFNQAVAYLGHIVVVGAGGK